MNEPIRETLVMPLEPSSPSEAVSDAGAGPSTGLPVDLLRQAARRLRVLAAMFGTTFFLANFVPAFIQGSLGDLVSNLTGWLPGTLAIGASIVVFVLAARHNIRAATLMNVGLIFGVLGSYAIALAQYWWLFSDPDLRLDQLEAFGLSWVAVWMLGFTILIPARPTKALLAALGSATAVPVVTGLAVAQGGVLAVPASVFFSAAVFPYIICTGMAFVSARVVYNLGTAIRRAREMGSYHLIELLGRGGMGEVWRAQHRMLARPAAIKLVRPEVVGELGAENVRVVLQRFEREAQATALMQSPHTIELFDFGIAADGTFYYVMELLEGFDLETLVEQHGPLPPGRVVHLLRQVCHSLGEAHAGGLIHRDIKPANIYTCRYGRDVDFVKVLDFGLVKTQQQGGRSAEVRLTAANVAGGTPAFMSPEQALGDRPLDGRSDLYAVGCVGYWLLTGQLVFEADNPLQVVMQHINAPPEPPCRRTEVPIPSELEAIILSCLAKDPAERPQTADELDGLLASAIDTEWTPEEARNWWDAHDPALHE